MEKNTIKGVNKIPKEYTFIGEKVYLNEKEKKLFIWLNRDVRIVQIFTEDNRMFGIEIPITKVAKNKVGK